MRAPSELTAQALAAPFVRERVASIWLQSRFMPFRRSKKAWKVRWGKGLELEVRCPGQDTAK